MTNIISYIDLNSNQHRSDADWPFELQHLHQDIT